MKKSAVLLSLLLTSALFLPTKVNCQTAEEYCKSGNEKFKEYDLNSQLLTLIKQLSLNPDSQ